MALLLEASGDVPLATEQWLHFDSLADYSAPHAASD